MVLNSQQIEEMTTAAKPLIAWMNENCHPHCKALVDCTGIELVEGIARAITLEFVKD